MSRPTKHVLAAALAVLIASPFSADAASWQTHRYENDGFQVEFSGEVA